MSCTVYQGWPCVAACTAVATRLGRSASSHASAVAASGMGGRGLSGDGTSGRRPGSTGYRMSIAVAAVCM